jgi:hypothetical protein
VFVLLFPRFSSFGVGSRVIFQNVFVITLFLVLPFGWMGVIMVEGEFHPLEGCSFMVMRMTGNERVDFRLFTIDVALVQKSWSFQSFGIHFLHQLVLFQNLRSVIQAKFLRLFSQHLDLGGLDAP